MIDIILKKFIHCSVLATYLWLKLLVNFYKIWYALGSMIPVSDKLRPGSVRKHSARNGLAAE